MLKNSKFFGKLPVFEVGVLIRVPFSLFRVLLQAGRPGWREASRQSKTGRRHRRRIDHPTEDSKRHTDEQSEDHGVSPEPPEGIGTIRGSLRPLRRGTATVGLTLGIAA
jgi:hypothetical protein